MAFNFTDWGEDPHAAESDENPTVGENRLLTQQYNDQAQGLKLGLWGVAD
jgi:hypothetical protein